MDLLALKRQQQQQQQQQQQENQDWQGKRHDIRRNIRNDVSRYQAGNTCPDISIS
jgi:hypothetical protein